MRIHITLLTAFMFALCSGCGDSSSSTGAPSSGTGQTPSSTDDTSSADEMPFSRSELKETRELLGYLERNLTLYASNNLGKYPDSLDALVDPPEPGGSPDSPATLGNPQQFKRAPLLKELPADPWGSPFQYRSRPFELWSLGPDKKEGHGDDISTWDIADELRFPERRGNATEERQRKLAMIGAAMTRFLDVYKKFPLINGIPGGPEEEKGLSWRVHLLPFLGEKDLYKQFKLDEPWDSPHNQPLIAKIPAVYQLSEGLEKGQTCLHLPTGPQYPEHERVAFMNAELIQKIGENAATKPADFRDGTSDTILAVVCGNSLAEPWTKPVDLPVDLKAPQASLGSPKDYAVVMADGQARILTRNVTDEVLRALLTSRGDDRDSLPH